MKKLSTPSSEHAYQAMKTGNIQDRTRISQASSPGEAKRLGRKVTLLPNFDKDKLNIMANILYIKFSNTSLREKLLQVDDVDLVE